MRKRRPAGECKKVCSKCGKLLEETRVGKQAYCTACHAEYMRENRPKHKNLPEDQRIKANARSYLNVYIRRGIIKKMPCEKCGNPKAEAHHEDYSKPLAVIWLCREHHLEIHKDHEYDISEVIQLRKNLLKSTNNG